MRSIPHRGLVALFKTYTAPPKQVRKGFWILPDSASGSGLPYSCGGASYTVMATAHMQRIERI
ncbi:MAG: hypothetical protein NVSMB6_26800 [Burkholderiaceae bacterium]